MYFIVYRAYDEFGNLHDSSPHHSLDMFALFYTQFIPHRPLALEQLTLTVHPQLLSSPG